MKNRVKIISLAMVLIISMVSIVGCSNKTTNTEASVSSSNVSTETSTEPSIEESSTSESSVEVSYETTSAAESSVISSSNSSAVDPDVEERSYSDEEKYKDQDTRIPSYKYYPAGKTYSYQGYETKITIPSDFSTCPLVYSKNVKEIIVPETVTKIPKGAFTGCTNLEKLVILNPDCEIEIGRILPPVDPNDKYNSYNNKLVDIYCYFMSDKSVPKTRQWGGSLNSKVLNKIGKYYSSSNYFKYIHDLATESYE